MLCLVLSYIDFDEYLKNVYQNAIIKQKIMIYHQIILIFFCYLEIFIGTWYFHQNVYYYFLQTMEFLKNIIFK